MAILFEFQLNPTIRPKSGRDYYKICDPGLKATGIIENIKG